MEAGRAGPPPVRASDAPLPAGVRLNAPTPLDLPPIAGLRRVAGSPYPLTLEALPGTGMDSFRRLLEWLPPGHELTFFDPFYPSISDPGAYVQVQRRGEDFRYYLGNHAWSTKWQRQSPELLAAYLALTQLPTPVALGSPAPMHVGPTQHGPWDG